MRTFNYSVLSIVLVGFLSVAIEPAEAINLSLNKEYAYQQNLPGQSGAHYLDDSHVQTLGTSASDFGTGILTDGAIAPGISAISGLNTPVAGWYNNATNPVPTDIIFDLGDTFVINNVTLGTHRSIASGNSTPDDVDIRFSTTGVLAGDFGNLVQAAFAEQTADGHHDLSVAVPSYTARYVKLSFDGNTADQPSAQKYFLDEVTINGNEVPPAPEPSSFLLLGLGAIGLVRHTRRRRRRR